ncbi:putative monacolin J acid methylbutanoyltransferase [[Candida] railenensis]|uniref:Monacolin J acid methylbutanoyltransferase n=1 Tax=[Candida] railenensis TaxID=45579 RepID=A0A9P0VXA2_9ASCO|nr:putative monacolin J acid methylbutanoyltransferase [[Candida] railenensis]
MKYSESSKDRLAKSIDKILESNTTPQKDGDLSTPTVHGIIAGVTSSENTLYLNSKGKANVETGEEMSVDHIMCLYSCTKAFTATAILQLHEQGKLDIDGEAQKYLPKIGEIGLIEEGSVSEEDGSFTIPPKAPKNPITIKHLLLHISGFAYAFTSIDYFHLMTKKDPHLNAIKPVPEYFSQGKMPLVFEPGSKFLYGHSSDWLGLVVKEVTGLNLGEYLKKYVFEPLGMDSCTFHLNEKAKFLELHRRTRKAGIVIHNSYVVDKDPAVDMGGQGCFGTVGDYLKFIRVWLNEGVSPDTGAILLQSDTIKYARLNHLPEEFLIDFSTASSSLLPEDVLSDGYTLAGCAFSKTNLPTGRPNSSIYWSGLANLYFWMDFENKIGGFWGTQLFPYFDDACVESYLDFEKTVYRELLSKGSKF